MPLSKPIVVALVLRQVVAIHLGDEAQLIGKREIPDFQRHFERQRFVATGQYELAGMDPGGDFMGDINFAVKTLRF